MHADTPGPHEPAASERTPRFLKPSHRCDSCGAQAYVAADFRTGELYFCAHHYARHEDALREQAIGLVDERWALALS